MHHQIVANQNRGVPLARHRRRARALRALPRHDLQIEHVHIIEVVFAVPAAEDVHLGAADDVGGVVVAAGGCSGACRALVPGHGDGVEGVQILKSNALSALASKNNDPGPRK